MFTGIIETLGKVRKLKREGGNLHITLQSNITSELKIDQSLAHNGVCLTVVSVNNSEYTVTAIDETLQKTNLGGLEIGTEVNLERCMRMNGRLDGHIVQGHVDTTGICSKIEEEDGSWKFTFSYTTADVTVAKGSITINGVSLTIVDSTPNSFSVCIIPYTYEHTNFNLFHVGSAVNLEFDIIGKYVAKLIAGN